MKFSVITISYNNAEGLRKTMESVFSQTCADYEPQFGISKACFCLKIVSIKAQKEDCFSYICC